ncbi:hypothetical protein F4808DRAFT_452953 [Astrocystis sublimbata]|nr:hypothetical protein F4808DRAFT_452953 [Astrocystis sublimbata]
MSNPQSFTRFGDLPTEVRLLIWEQHFNSYFPAPHIHTLNGGYLSKKISSLRPIICRGRLLKTLADRYEWTARDAPVLQFKTILPDMPAAGDFHLAHRDAVVTWPKLHPFINHEALNVARTRCEPYDAIDLWLDESTLNISQPCLVKFTSDVFRIDPYIAKITLKLNSASWLARIRRIAIGPITLCGHCEALSILRFLHQTRDLDEIYILLSPGFIKSQTSHPTVCAQDRRDRLAVTDTSTAGFSGSKIRMLGIPASDGIYVTGDSGDAAALRTIIDELTQRYDKAKIMYGCLDV